jgi:hypothetical protein
MEYAALGSVEATDGGRAEPYPSSEEREGREPDGVRFDRERAHRLWEAVSGAQPVGREEGESGGAELDAPRPPALLAESGGNAALGGRPAPEARVTPPGAAPPPCVTRPGLADSSSPAGPGWGRAQGRSCSGSWGCSLGEGVLVFSPPPFF